MNIMIAKLFLTWINWYSVVCLPKLLNAICKTAYPRKCYIFKGSQRFGFWDGVFTCLYAFYSSKWMILKLFCPLKYSNLNQFSSLLFIISAELISFYLSAFTTSNLLSVVMPIYLVKDFNFWDKHFSFRC